MSGTRAAYLHRNSQKRFYEEGAEYFITSVTGERHPYFSEPFLAESFIRDLWFAKELKQFDLYGYTVMPDHVHLLFQPTGKSDYSEIMRSVKTNFSRNANDILLNRAERFQIPIEADVTSHRFRKNPNTNTMAPRRMQQYQHHYLNVVKPLYLQFVTRYGINHGTPRFVWQKSFRDHLIRDEDDYLNHLEYIYNNAVKHGMVGKPEQYPWMWIGGMKSPFAPD